MEISLTSSVTLLRCFLEKSTTLVWYTALVWYSGPVAVCDCRTLSHGVAFFFCCCLKRAAVFQTFCHLFGDVEREFCLTSSLLILVRAYDLEVP